MVIYLIAIQIPFFFIGIVLWILCCHLAKKQRETEDWASSSSSPSVYIIPIHEEEEDEEVMDIHAPYFHPPYRDPPVYSSGNVSPPPYWLEPPSYSDPPPSYPEPPPSYTDLPAYSEQP
ncbi:proline-rich protein 3-like [Toxotes jaculatrix]|uniref:proline-rich protein 3-like n=1 Tax=Toxotes jaculatrix TaxID=941984 RepID=UPI001B3B04C6|nr:proline-rich protein 3-like [Toxotes jaculatrix]